VKPPYLTDEVIKVFISRALEEDIGDGDFTSMASIPEDETSRAKLIAKDSGIAAGVELAERIFHFVDADLEVKVFKSDGQDIKEGDEVLTVAGRARNILSSERLVLNCMQRMSGIATFTNRLVRSIQDTKARIIDTRKTTPNFRLMEKWAVVLGGGVNHRLGLFDQILLKDNHVDIAGGVTAAVSRARDFVRESGKTLKIEVETRNLKEVEEALASKVDIIMLDNMSPDLMRKAVSLINHQCTVEASGGITEKNVKEIAATGVDLISIGALTHSYKSLDMSLKTF